MPLKASASEPRSWSLTDIAVWFAPNITARFREAYSVHRTVSVLESGARAHAAQIACAQKMRTLSVIEVLKTITESAVVRDQGWRERMKVIADLCVVPMGIGVSVSREVAVCERILAEAGLQTRLHAYGTNIEGEWDTVFGAIKRCHEAIHAMGVPRISTNLRVGTRIDRQQTMEDKVRSVERSCEKPVRAVRAYSRTRQLGPG